MGGAAPGRGAEEPALPSLPQSSRRGGHFVAPVSLHHQQSVRRLSDWADVASPNERFMRLPQLSESPRRNVQPAIYSWPSSDIDAETP